MLGETTIVYNAKVVTHTGCRQGWVEIKGGVVTERGGGTECPARHADKYLDAKGAFLMPGLVDSHVHFREPGLESKGTIRSESLAAVAGGVCTVFDMPNTVPATTTVARLTEKMLMAQWNGCYTRYHALLGITPGGLCELKKLETDRAAAVKLFLGTSTGAMAAPEGQELEDIFRYCADHALPIIVHAEDNDIIAANTAAAIAQYGSADKIPVSMHQAIRSREACLKASARAVELAERFGTRLHLAHISTADEVRQLLTEGSSVGKLITAETTPLYLDPILAHETNRTSLHKVNPAIKTPADAEALRNALYTGAIDTIGTDHAPHLLSEKKLPGITAASGAPSIQFALPLMLSYLQPEKIVEKMTVGPAAVFDLACNINFGVGQPADMTLVREVEPYYITYSDVLSTCAWTPFAGREIRHRVERTWVAGKEVWNNGPTQGFAANINISIARK
ncbi:MAG: amidohydrolase family protein [Muribaculaceae bacterium]|nr:amidohydrolase family protein [Muribaculaceae bacterium]